MSLGRILLLFALYSVIVAAGLALLHYQRRRSKPQRDGLIVPNVAGIKRSVPTPEIAAAWPVRVPPSARTSAAIDGAAEIVTHRPAAASPAVPVSAGELPAVPVSPTELPAVPVSPATMPPAAKPHHLNGVAPRVELGSVEAVTYEDRLAAVFPLTGELLPEGLRTLQVMPNRAVEPGTTVEAAFIFRNLGGGTATGFRVRFRLPDGLTYAAGSARIDESALDDRDGMSPMLLASGAEIGDIPAGGERRVALAYTVAGTIENGTPIAIQVAVASIDVPVIGSNIIRLIVRSLPVLQNAATFLELAAGGEALPGEELQLTAHVHNCGQSSAHELVVLLPLPAHTTYVSRSVLVDGRAFADGSQNAPLGFARPTAVAPFLAPGDTVTIGYRVRVDGALEDATPIVAQGSVCSQEVAEFALAPAQITVKSAAAFADDDTALRIACDDEVAPGECVRIVLYAKNGGTAPARGLSLRVALPEGLAYTAGSLAIDGATAPDRGAIPETIRLGDLDPGKSVELAISAIVRSPISNGHALRVFATVAWSKGQRTFERVLTARSSPRFPANFNKIERDTPMRVGPGDAVAYSLALLNMGTDDATNVRLQFNADAGLEHLCLLDAGVQIAALDGRTVTLDALEPGVPRLLRIEGRVAPVIEDQTELQLQASLLSAQIPQVELGVRIHVVDSRPTFSTTTSQIVAETKDPLRFRGTSSYRISLLNEGTDRGRDIRIALELPAEMEFDAVEGATGTENALRFGDIAAGERREAVVHLRLAGIVASGDAIRLSGRLSGLNVVPLALVPIVLNAHAQASFADDAVLRSQPGDAIDAGAEIGYTLALCNSGDGAAKHVTIRIAALTNAVYAQGSTTINGIELQDTAGTSPLLNAGGLRLADVGAGVEVVARWRAIVNMPLPPSTLIGCGAIVQWDEVPALTITAAPITVRSASALPIIEPALPFSVLGAVAALPRAMRADLSLRPSVTPAAAPVHGSPVYARNAAHARPALTTSDVLDPSPRETPDWPARTPVIAQRSAGRRER